MLKLPYKTQIFNFSKVALNSDFDPGAKFSLLGLENSNLRNNLFLFDFC